MALRAEPLGHGSLGWSIRGETLGGTRCTTAGKAAFNPSLQQTMAQYILSSQDLFQTVFKGFLFLAHRESLLSVGLPLALLGCSDLRVAQPCCGFLLPYSDMGCCKSLPSFPQTFLYLGFLFTSGILPRRVS